MASPISAYNTDRTGAEAPKDVTKTDVAGDKVALDVAIKEGTGISGDFTPGGLRNAGLYTAVSIPDNAWVAIPSTALTDRNQINIQNFTGFEMKVNHSGTGGYADNGMRIPSGTERFYQITEGIAVYARMAPGAGTQTIDVEEL